MAETSAEREAARGVILEHHLVPIMFEEFHGRFRFDQQAEALRRLFESDVLLLILDESFSMQVHSEFYAAVSQQKQVWVFLRERVSPVKPELQDFVENTLAPHYLYERFRDVDDLKFKIQKRIKKP